MQFEFEFPSVFLPPYLTGECNLAECSDNNHLEVRDGYWHRSKLLARLCGTRSHLPPIVSTGSRMLITYKTADNSVPQTGFVAGYEGGHLVISIIDCIQCVYSLIVFIGLSLQ